MRYDVTEFSVIGDGKTNNTKAIEVLIQRVRENSGGTLYFPCGKYVTGSVRLFSNMGIYLDAGAVILGSTDYADYPKITQEVAPGYTRDTYRALITAFSAENIFIEGNGKIDGRGSAWWHKTHDTARPRAIQPILCKNVRISEITVENSPCWTVHPMCCENVTIDGITIKNPYDSPNTDGSNPESSRNVRISNCCVDVGDDCITIKSGTEDDDLQKKFPCENITVTNCTMIHGHGGVVIGSEMSGGIKNVVISNCVFQNTDRGIRVKTRRKRGGYMKDIIVSNIIMENILAGITVNEYYSCGADPNDTFLFSDEKMPPTADTPEISGISLSNITGRNIKGVGMYMYGLPEKPISNVRMSNIDFEVTGSNEGINAVSSIGRKKSFGEGIFLENARDIIMTNMHIQCSKKKYELKHCERVQINGEML